MDEFEFRLLNDFQRGFPLVPAPFAQIAERLHTSEAAVLKTLRLLAERGSVSRVGAVLAPRRVGASTLAALAAPPMDVSRVANLISRHPEVNHNYEREHRLNLWFVATAPGPEQLAALLDSIQLETACRVISLPLVEEFHIDLAFDLSGAQRPHRPVSGVAAAPAYAPDPQEKRLMAALQTGLDLVPRPYVRLAMRCGSTEAQVIDTLGRWLDAGLVKRLGVVVRHREVGYSANAMVVFDLPDEEVGVIGARLAGETMVTLCYRRRRHLPEWPYNLFCMIHGRHRLDVERAIGALRDRLSLHRYPSAVLFSRRCFKQHGARYFDQAESARG
jgi:DNA-binding Lrp family transcriptional regulator